MPNWVEDLLPYVVPAVLALLTATITSTMLMPRRLRKELIDETQLLAGLRGTSKGLVAADISFKAVRLSGWNRYPALTPQDLIRGAVILVLVGFSAAGALELAIRPPTALIFETHIVPLILYVSLVGGQWYALYGNLVWRRKDRISFWTIHGAPAAVDDQDFTEVSGAMAWMSFGVIAVVGPPGVQIFLLTDALDVRERYVGLIALGMTAAAALVFYAGSRAEKARPVGMRRRIRLEAEDADRRRAAKSRASAAGDSGSATHSP